MKEYSYGVCPYRINNYCTEILIIRSKGHTEWGFIKGKIDKNETPQECAKRETLEETNIKFKKKYLEDYYYQINKNKNIGIFLIDSFNIDISNIILEEREIEEIKWVKLDISDIAFNKNQTKILNQIKNKFINRIYYFSNKEYNEK